MTNECSIGGCDTLHYAKGLCKKHYERLRSTGTTESSRTSVEDRFWVKVDDSGGPDSCWLWKAVRDRHGYGLFHKDGKRMFAHRVAYEITTGQEIGPLDIDHICHTTACCNPLHLRPVTRKQNIENRAGAQSNSKSGIRGVIPHSSGAGWQVEVGHNGKRVYVGYFSDIKEAEAAAIQKRMELFTHNNRDRGITT